MMSLQGIETWIPGLKTARTYRREWFRSDLVAGVSVAAVDMPIGIAYAQLAGFPPAVGIYSCILPPVAYALFGSSRQLIVNPDAAACAIVAATVAPLAVGGSAHYAELAIVLTFFTGLLCIAGGLAGLGVIANFLSRPILTGYLNGIALSIIAGQLGTLLGFNVSRAGFFRTVVEAFSRLRETHIATLLVGLSLFVLLRALKHLAPKVPAPLLAAAAGIIAASALNLERRGVAVVGSVPSGFPALHIPSINSAEIWPLIAGAGGIALVSFCSMMTTARGFATKNGYTIDVNRDMSALGFSDLASGLTSGFVVSGADSRTAVADSSGGKTQMTSIVAAAMMAVVLLFLTGPVASLPATGLAAIFISSALGLFDFASLRNYYRLSKPEFRHSVVAMAGVMTIGVLPGVLIAVGLALLKLLQQGSRPHDALLGVTEVNGEIHSANVKTGAKTIPGLIIYRFNAPLLFFNADYFRERAREMIKTAGSNPRWFLLDAGGMIGLDVTGADSLDEFRRELVSSGMELAIARASGNFWLMLQRSGIAEAIGPQRLFPAVHTGAQAFLASQSAQVEGRSSASSASSAVS